MRIPELIGEIWLNRRVRPEELQGKIILIDFWTYTCANCLRTIPYLEDWWKKYQNQNFVIIGVHTPEFDFEKNINNVKQAVKELGIEWPIILDNDYENWDSFDNRYWPAKYLFDQEGNLVYTHFGEGNYEETELAIQKLLSSEGVHDLPEIVKESIGGACFKATPELYLGKARGAIANAEDYVANTDHKYSFPLAQISQNSIALDGNFYISDEYVETRELGATILVRFDATEVNLVLRPVEREASAIISFDQKLLEPGIRGSDLNENGEATITKSAMYNLLKSPKRIKGDLTIRAEKGNFQAFAFTFSGCEKF